MTKLEVTTENDELEVPDTERRARRVIGYRLSVIGHFEGQRAKSKGKPRRAEGKAQGKTRRLGEFEGRKGSQSERAKFVILRLASSHFHSSSSTSDGPSRVNLSKTSNMEASSNNDRRAMFKN